MNNIKCDNVRITLCFKEQEISIFEMDDSKIIGNVPFISNLSDELDTYKFTKYRNSILNTLTNYGFNGVKEFLQTAFIKDWSNEEIFNYFDLGKSELEYFNRNEFCLKMYISKSIFIINGCGRSGKDTFVHMCKDAMMGTMYCVENISSIDTVRKMLKKTFCYNPDDKSDEARKMLSDIKKSIEEYDGSITTEMINKSKLFKYDISNDSSLFIHIREPESISHYKDRYLDPAVKTILIRNPNITPIESNDSDKFVEDYHYDLIIDNDGSLEEFKSKAEHFIENCWKRII